MASTFFIPDTDFAKAVVAEYPDLANLETSDLQRVTILRQWAWSHIDYAPSAEAAKLFQADAAWIASDAPEYFARFEKLEGGVICGGAARGLWKLYKYFGYRAWAYGCECEPGGPSHAVALVDVEIGGEPRIIVQDASYNATLCDAETGEPLSVFEVLERLRDRRHESIRVDESDYHSISRWPRYVIAPQFTAIHTPEHCLKRDGYIIDGVATYETKADGTIVFRSPRSWHYFAKKKCYEPEGGRPAVILPEIIARGYPPSLVYMYVKPQSLNGPDAKALMQRLREVAGS